MQGLEQAGDTLVPEVILEPSLSAALDIAARPLGQDTPKVPLSQTCMQACVVWEGPHSSIRPSAVSNNRMSIQSRTATGDLPLKLQLVQIATSVRRSWHRADTPSLMH